MKGKTEGARVRMARREEEGTVRKGQVSDTRYFLDKYVASGNTDNIDKAIETLKSLK